MINAKQFNEAFDTEPARDILITARAYLEVTDYFGDTWLYDVSKCSEPLPNEDFDDWFDKNHPERITVELLRSYYDAVGGDREHAWLSCMGLIDDHDPNREELEALVNELDQNYPE